VSNLAQSRKPGPAPPPKEREKDRDWFDVVAGYAGLVWKLCAVVFVGALGYIVYATYTGSLNGPIDPRILRNINWMGQAVLVAGAVGTIALALATLDEVAYIAAAFILGLGLILGTPMFILSKLQQPTADVENAIRHWNLTAGWAICGLAALRVLYYIIEIIRKGPKARERALAEESERMGPKRVKRTQGVWSACWQLPYCHDTIREVCPAYKERKSCWKFGRGCNCDPTLVETMIRSGAARIGKGQDKVSAQKQQTADEYLREALGARQPGGAAAAQGRTVECAKCPIYGEHQRQKFNIVNPAAIVATIAALTLAYPLLRRVYLLTIAALAGGASELTLGKETAVGRWIDYLNTPTVQVFFFGILALFILSWVLKIVEWLVFTKKL